MSKGRLEAFSDAYAASVPLAFVSRVVACLLFAAVALIWLVPDRRIEQALAGIAR